MAAMFAARIASLTLAMISVESTIELLNKMRIVPSFGTCSTCRDTKLAFFSRSFINLRVAFSFLPLPKRCKKRDHSSTKQMSVGDQGVMIMIGRATTCKNLNHISMAYFGQMIQLHHMSKMSLKQLHKGSKVLSLYSHISGFVRQNLVVLRVSVALNICCMQNQIQCTIQYVLQFTAQYSVKFSLQNNMRHAVFFSLEQKPVSIAP